MHWKQQKKRVQELEAENRQLRAYINGMERGLRARQPQIKIEGRERE